MSLYTLNEICEKCIHSIFIDGKETNGRGRIFLRCKINVESFVDSCRAKCDDKLVPKNPKTVYSDVKLTIEEVVEGSENV